MAEIWKQIPGYEMYSVSNRGNICRGTRILKPTLNSAGYHIVSLCRDGISKTMSVSRLVAKAFIPNLENKPTVDHINRIRTHNSLENLRWATSHEQGMNRDYPIGKTNLRHITAQYGGFKVQIRRHGALVVAKWFKDLEEAVITRDAVLETLTTSYSESPVTPEDEPVPQLLVSTSP